MLIDERVVGPVNGNGEVALSRLVLGLQVREMVPRIPPGCVSIRKGNGGAITVGKLNKALSDYPDLPEPEADVPGGARMKELREKSGFSQSQAARASGVPQSTIANYELGQRDLDPDRIRTLMDLYANPPKEEPFDFEAVENSRNHEDLRAARVAAGLRQVDAAAEIGLRLKTFQAYERGERVIPSAHGRDLMALYRRKAEEVG